MVEHTDANDSRVTSLLDLGTGATREQIANLLDKHKGQMDAVAVALLDGNFRNENPEIIESDERGRQIVKSTAPALPPRRKQNSPVDNSRALVRVDSTAFGNPPLYNEEDELNKALALSLGEQGPPPLEPIDDGLPMYGPVQDPQKARDLDQSTDHALRRALEASLNDGKNSLAADVYSELPIEQQVRLKDGRPTALRSSDQNSIFVPPIFQALLSVPQLLTRLKQLQSRPHGGDLADTDGEMDGVVMEGIDRMLDRPWADCEATRAMFTHAECTQEAYIDIQQWAEQWTQQDMSHSPANTAADLLHRITRSLNLSLPSPHRTLFLPTIHDPSSSSPPPPATPLPPHLELTQPHQDHLLYTVPLNTSGGSTLIDALETQVSSDRVGFVGLPESLVFKVERLAGGGGKFGFPSRLWMDRWMLEKREFVEGSVMRRAKEIEVLVNGMRDEREKLTKHEGRDTFVDLTVSIKHFETSASDGGDPKRKERNERTLNKLKTILKDFEDRCDAIAKKTEELQTESAGLWNQPELMTMPYDLHAVVIHDGLLGRAHLFSYVRRGGKWWKVVDSDVTEVAEETVLDDSAGVHLGAGVLALIYARPMELEDNLKWPHKDRLKTQKLNETFRSKLSIELQKRLAEESQPVSTHGSDDEEDEFMDAEEMIVVATEQDVADEVLDVPDDVSMDEVVPGDVDEKRGTM